MVEKNNDDLIEEFDESKPAQSAILTQEMADIINVRKQHLIIGNGVFIILSQFPISSYSKNKSKVIKYLKSIPRSKFDNLFLQNSKNKEIEMELIFFLARDYNKRDVDNFIKIITDSLIDFWYEDDSQIKKIIAEKIQVNDMKKDVDPRLYEQIYASARIIPNTKT